MRSLPTRLAGVLLALALPAGMGRAQSPADTLVWIEGGVFRHGKSNYAGKPLRLAGFFLGKYEVTQREWTGVMGGNPSAHPGETLPVETVSWYDCIEYCNRRSLKEGLKPCYTIDKTRPDPANTNAIDTLKWTVTRDAGANGYRLPTEAEWEYAASGGQKSQGFNYSGSDDIEEAAWYWRNAAMNI